jgi:DEAD/DEAH box helicase domain-containing protein
VVHVREIPPRQAKYAQPRRPLGEAMASLLRRQNIHQLYTHQASALDAIAAGADVVIVTSTASGKTLCYNLPVAQMLLDDPSARALYLFPTKALAQDQLGTLQRWAGEESLSAVLKPAVYDGDTPAHNRAKIRADASVILTNPDMLHVGMLPYHAKWHAFLRSLRYIVVDELHSYRGIFGSQVAGVLRRLLRMCEHYGSRPQVICCSATIANPLELAGKLTGRDMALIDNDGSPRGRKYFVLWNPPLIDTDSYVAQPPSAVSSALPSVPSSVAHQQQQDNSKTQPGAAVPQQLPQQQGIIRRSANVEAMELLTELVRRRTQTIAFTKARVVAELIYKYAREALAGDGSAATRELAERIRPYRGGYLPSERREIEKELFSGRLLAVITTNALELGIDIGALDAAILVGFPGTICSTWQQAGRAGRTSQDSLVFLVGYNEPIDQYLMRHPEYLFGASHEHGVIDPDNPHILGGQLACACFEKPLSPDDERYFGPLTTRVADILAEEGQLKPLDGRYYWRSAEFPARGVNLRMVSSDTFSIVLDDSGENGTRDSGFGIREQKDGKKLGLAHSLPQSRIPNPASRRVIGNVDAISAPELVYPQAIYLHEGKSYLVKSLDCEARVALVAPADVDYYTQPVLASSCRLDEHEDTKPYADGEMFFGPAEVTWQTTAFRKVKYYSMELVGQCDLDLPAQTLPTTAMWWTPSEAMRNGIAAAGYNPIEAMMGVRNLMLSALPSLAMCDRRDISGMVDSANRGAPTIVIYDRYQGGMGFAQRGYELIDDWLTMAALIVGDCPCDGGCPSCVGLANLRPPLHQDPDLQGGAPVPNKEATIIMLNMIKQALGNRQ